MFWKDKPKEIDISFSDDFIYDIIDDKITLYHARRIIEKEFERIIIAKAPKETEGTTFCCWHHGYVVPGIPPINMDGHVVRKDK